MSNEKYLLGPDGKPVPQMFAIEYKGKKYPFRQVSNNIIHSQNSFEANLATLVQIGDSDNMFWLALLILAKDVYTGSQEFLEFSKQLNLAVVDLNRGETLIAEELEKAIAAKRAEVHGAVMD